MSSCKSLGGESTRQTLKLWKSGRHGSLHHLCTHGSQIFISMPAYVLSSRLAHPKTPRVHSELVSKCRIPVFSSLRSRPYPFSGRILHYFPIRQTLPRGQEGRVQRASPSLPRLNFRYRPSLREASLPLCLQRSWHT